jgi:hypothetical protein
MTYQRTQHQFLVTVPGPLLYESLQVLVPPSWDFNFDMSREFIEALVNELRGECEDMGGCSCCGPRGRGGGVERGHDEPCGKCESCLQAAKLEQASGQSEPERGTWGVEIREPDGSLRVVTMYGDSIPLDETTARLQLERWPGYGYDCVRVVRRTESDEWETVE